MLKLDWGVTFLYWAEWFNVGIWSFWLSLQFIRLILSLPYQPLIQVMLRFVQLTFNLDSSFIYSNSMLLMVLSSKWDFFLESNLIVRFSELGIIHHHHHHHTRCVIELVIIDYWKSGQYLYLMNWLYRFL